MEHLEDRIKAYKNSLEGAKNKVAQLQGSVGMLLHRLKDELGIDSIEEAKKRKDEIFVKKEELNKKMEVIVNKIEEQYDFGF